MNKNTKTHHRRSIRLKEYDYSQTGAYFVTICTQDKKCVLGKIINKKTILNNYGKIVEKEWLKTKSIRPYVDLDYYVIMPNHLHGIILLLKSDCKGLKLQAPTNNFSLQPHSLGSIIRGFKSSVTSRINKIQNTPGKKFWQRNYYEHIIRNDEDLNRVREYIKNNPLIWRSDKHYPMVGA